MVFQKCLYQQRKSKRERPDNEFETMQLFHGIEITYEPLDDSDLNSKEFDDSITIALDQIVMKNSSSIKRLKLLMYQKNSQHYHQQLFH